MGEEMDHDEQARIVLEGQEAGFWTLDPLDGTTNFAMGFPFYGVSLALVKHGEPKQVYERQWKGFRSAS